MGVVELAGVLDLGCDLEGPRKKVLTFLEPRFCFCSRTATQI